MTVHGVCIATDPALMPAADQLTAFSLVRLVYTPVPDCHAAIHAYQAQGLTVAVVLARESFGNGYPATLAATCDTFARNCAPDLIVVGNEMDAWALGEPSPASWSMTPEQYAELWATCEEVICARLFGCKLAIGGLVSGQPGLAPEYVRAVKRVGGHPSAIDIHPYARDAESAAGLLYAYQSLLSMPYVVLEWNREAAEIPAFVRMIERRGITHAAYFSLHQFDVPALMDEQGNPTERYESYVQALSGPQAIETKEVTMGKLEATEGQERWWVAGGPWPEPPEPPMKVTEIQTMDGGVVRLRGYQYGLGIELPDGTVYQPGEGSDTSFAHLFANALQYEDSREVMRAALEAAGFRIVPA